jgi:N-dimethylarginine dimethylaminohydrolase
LAQSQVIPETAAVYNGHSSVGRLRKVVVCSPLAAGWHSAEQTSRWRELGYFHAPDFAAAQAQHEALPGAGEFTLDAVYVHDASLPTDFGAVLMRPGKSNRLAEAGVHRGFYERLNIPVLGEITAPGCSEAGDMVWLDSRTLLIGRGYRTNVAGIEQMRRLLEPKSVNVVSAPLPHCAGPATCLHLMSLLSVLDEKTVLVDAAWLAVETMELLSARGFALVEIEESERNQLACNVLALGGRRLLALAENTKTNQRLRQAGFDVRTFPGSELCFNGSGGPTCLTRPLLRD